MRWAFSLGMVALCAAAGAAEARAPLADPVSLNIGINCQWQQRCMKAQTKAMKRSLKSVNKAEIPVWRVQLCNRNAGRQRARVDWVGFENCIRNVSLRPLPARVIKPQPRLKPTPRPSRKKTRRASPPPPAPVSAPGPGERG